MSVTGFNLRRRKALKKAESVTPKKETVVEVKTETTVEPVKTTPPVRKKTGGKSKK